MEDNKLRKHRLFVGNPGVGKSTLLNCLMKDKVASNQLFKSGVSISKGMTYELDTRVVDKITYMDTPGLEDVDRRKQAAEAITEALKKDGDYQVVFVVTLESGRVRPVDVATIRIVLENARDIRHYGVIINKLTTPVYARLTAADDKERNELLAQIGYQDEQEDKPLPVPLFLQKVQELEDYDDVVTDIPELETFLNELPYLIIHKEKVTDIPSDNTFEKYNEELEKKLSELLKNNEEMQRRIEEDRRQSEQRLDRMREEESKRHMDVMGTLEKQHQQNFDRFMEINQKMIDRFSEDRTRDEERNRRELDRLSEQRKGDQEQFNREKEREDRKNDGLMKQINSLTDKVNSSRRGSGGGCFDVNGTVMVKLNFDIVKTKLSDLKEGDLVKTINDEGEIEFSKVYYIAHANENKRSELLSIYYEGSMGSVEKIGLSDRHLIYVSKDNKDKLSAVPVMAGQIKKGDYIWVVCGTDFIAKPIIDVQQYMAYVVHPLTENHHIIVDDVHASVHIINESLYRTITSPLKWVCWMFPDYTHSSFVNRAVRLVEDFKEPFAKMKIGDSLDAVFKFQ